MRKELEVSMPPLSAEFANYPAISALLNRPVDEPIDVDTPEMQPVSVNIDPSILSAMMRYLQERTGAPVPNTPTFSMLAHAVLEGKAWADVWPEGWRIANIDDLASLLNGNDENFLYTDPTGKVQTFCVAHL